MQLMTSWFDALVGFGVGLLLGAAGAACAFLVLAGRIRHALHNVRVESQLLEAKSEQLASEVADLKNALQEAHERREEAAREAAALAEKAKAYEVAESRLKESFRSAGAEALAANSRQFLELARQGLQTVLAEATGDQAKRQQAIEGLVRPISDLLERQQRAVADLEKRREGAYRGLEEQIKSIAASHEKLGVETGRLVTALRRPEQRGRWGELQLRNAVELAGMTEHCDFQEQPQTEDAETRDRPDMTVNLPGGGVIVVDAKVALDAYLDALSADGVAADALKRHAELVETHYKKLAERRYWEQFEHTPKLVVMFMPMESALVAALERKPDLHAEAMQRHVLIATPTLFVALLRAVAYGWQQQALAANARQISEVGRELYERLDVFVKHLEKAGSGLTYATRAYNDAIGSLERRVLPGARRLKELHATTEEAIEPPPAIEIETRPVTTPELKGVEEGLNAEGRGGPRREE
jgi:DNA recombination protein RmuC